MQVRIDNIAASCPHCGTMDFIASESGASADEKLACGSCGQKTSRAQLLIQIGDEAARQAAQSLAELKRKRASPR